MVFKSLELPHQCSLSVLRENTEVMAYLLMSDSTRAYCPPFVLFLFFYPKLKQTSKKERD